jgi:hypothetical protein
MRGTSKSARSNHVGFKQLPASCLQRRLDAYGSDSLSSGDFVTITRDPLGSNVHRSESPASTPKTSTTVDGTVVRSESERSIALTNLDSMGLGTESSPTHRAGIDDSVGQHVRQRVGSNLKYSRAVGQHVGRHMAADLGTVTGREGRAFDMLHAGSRVAESSKPGEYVVASQSGKGLYRVRNPGPLSGPEDCTCPDFAERRAPCKHVYLVRHWLSTQVVDPSTPVTTPRPCPPAPRKRNWALYDQSQTEEYRLFRTLLRDLSIGFTELVKDPTLAGRKPIPLREQAFYAVQRSYLGFSLRRSQDFRKQAVMQGLLSDAHFWALPSRFLCREDVTDGLHNMLARSAIPLIGLEDRCAIDSTGVRSTRFNYYRKEKYDPSRENIWLKLHALVGVKTHGIPVLEVTSGSAGDSPQYPVLLKRAAANGFRFKEAYADKAYQSRENFNTAADLEVLPFIPFKSNQTGQSKGSPMYHKMFLFFQYHREEFDQHYGQRAQVESTFGAFKQKLSETVSSKKFTSQVNEILCMAIAYNITVLVRQMFESGILPDFLRPSANVPVPNRPEENLGNSLCLNRPQLNPPVTFSTPPR